ncbi:unnamed protein product [Nesidiocoris tenuis]|uniref:Uncharacterized protein n=1 Tax=Nesidiocoris tenuis TaxID=355587 RepID=A0A6H5HAM0_9HEMI|nr:unnamed protein product [Nesidiocoris tenuis]
MQSKGPEQNPDERYREAPGIGDRAPSNLHLNKFVSVNKIPSGSGQCNRQGWQSKSAAIQFTATRHYSPRTFTFVSDEHPDRIIGKGALGLALYRLLKRLARYSNSANSTNPVTIFFNIFFYILTAVFGMIKKGDTTLMKVL